MVNVSIAMDGMSDIRTEICALFHQHHSNLVRSNFSEVLGSKTNWHILKEGYKSTVESENEIVPRRMLLERVDDLE